MIVVSNTSPMTNLAAIGQVELLPSLYQSIVIPKGVWEELQAPEKSWPGKDDIVNAEWLEKKAPGDLSRAVPGRWGDNAWGQDSVWISGSSISLG